MSERILDEATERGLMNRMLARNLIRQRVERLARTARLKRGRLVEPEKREAPPSVLYERRWFGWRKVETTNTKMRRLLEAGAVEGER